MVVCGSAVFQSVHLFQNLDVNQAVNNLLSREDDDGDDDGEAGIIRLGFPPGGKLLAV